MFRDSHRFFVSSVGSPSSGKSPRVVSEAGAEFKADIALPPGMFAIPEKDDEVIVLTPFNSRINQVITSVIPNYSFDIKPGDRLYYSDRSHLLLEKVGNATLAAEGEITLVARGASRFKVVDPGGAEIGAFAINDTGQMEIRNNSGASIKLNTDGTIDMN